MKKTQLGFLGVAFMYVGAIMGAGFASGREIWQFFGVFGTWGYIGILLVTGLFMMVGFMTSKIACLMNTNDMGKVVVPGENRFFKNLVANFMGAILFIAIVTMSAAGGALFEQQFGLSRLIGGAIIVCLVIATVIGGFDRVARVFRLVMPVLMTVVVVVSAAVIVTSEGTPDTSGTFAPSPLAANWWLAAVVYMAYNILGVIPIVATASINAKSKRHSYSGAVLGGLFLGALAFILLNALVRDMTLSDTMALPMLAFAGKLSPTVNVVYTVVLFFAIYASATSNFYGFTLRMIKEPHRKLKIIIAAWIGFACGLVGFTRLVAYLFPITGFFGVAIVVMLIANFIQITRTQRLSSGRL